MATPLFNVKFDDEEKGPTLKKSKVEGDLAPPAKPKRKYTKKKIVKDVQGEPIEAVDETLLPLPKEKKMDEGVFGILGIKKEEKKLPDRAELERQVKALFLSNPKIMGSSAKISEELKKISDLSDEDLQNLKLVAEYGAGTMIDEKYSTDLLSTIANFAPLTEEGKELFKKDLLEDELLKETTKVMIGLNIGSLPTPIKWAGLVLFKYLKNITWEIKQDDQEEQNGGIQ